MLIIIILICIIICIIILLNRKIIEGIDNSVTTQGSKFGSTKKTSFKGTYSGTFNGRMAIDDQYYYDKLFDDVVYYPNEYNDDYKLNDLKTSGYDKCLEECPGNCVAFGLTDNAYCFTY